MKDNWELTKLFRFETNDISDNSDGSKYQIPFHPELNEVDKQVFNEILNSIVLKYTTALDDGQILEGLRFLNFHYKRTRLKRRFLLFVKYYILSKSWMTKEAKEKYNHNDSFLSDWIKQKETKKRQQQYFPWIILYLLLFISGIFFSEDYKQLFLGAFVGIFAGQFGWMIGKIRPDQ